jgi:TP901 family phage tail tape measure protein
MGTIANLAIKITGDVGDLKEALSDAASSISKAGDKLQGLGSKLSLGVTAPLAGIATMAIKSAADFEQSMNVMQQVSGATAADMQALQEQALQLGAQTSFSAGEAAEAMLELAKAGLSASEISAAIGGTLDLAAAGGLGLAQAAEITANAVNAFGLEASQASSVANMLAAAANASSVEVTDLAQGMQMASAVFSSSGQSLATLNTALAILGNNGLKGSDAGTSLKTMLMRLTAPTDDAAEKLRELGVSVYDAAGNMRALPEVMADLQRALYDTQAVTVTSSNLTQEQAERMKYLEKIIESTQRQLADYQSGIAGVAQSENDKIVAVDRLNRVLQAAQAEYASLASIGGTTSTVMRTLTEEQRAQALATIFGSDAIRAVNILLKEGQDGWAKMAAALNNETAAADVANARMKGMAGAIEYFKGSVDSFLISTALPFLDSLSGIVRMAADGITALGSLPEPIQRTGLIVAGVAAAAGPALVGMGTALKVAAVGASGLSAALGFLASPIGLLIGAVALLGVAWATNFGGIQEATANLVAQLQPKIDEIKGWMEAQIPAALATAQAVWSNFASTATTAWSNFAASIAPAIEGLGPIITQMIDWLQAQIPGAIGATQAAWNSLSAIAATSGQKIVDLFGELNSKLPELQSNAISIIQAIGEFMAPAFERLATATAELPGKMAALQPNIEKISGAFGNLMNAIQPILAALGVGLVVAANFGVNLVAAAFENLPGLLQPIIDTAINTINLIADTVRGMVEVIKNIAKGDWAGAWEAFKGVIDGFKTYFNTTLENIKSFGSTIFDTLKTAVLGTLTDLDSSAKSQMNSLKSWWDGIWESLDDAFEPVRSGIDRVKEAIDSLKNAIEAFKNWIGGLSIPNPFAGIQLPALPALPTLPGFQLGTAYAHGGWSWVGENRRPELVFLPRGAQVVPWQEASKAAGGGGVNVTIQNATIRSEQDIWELAYRIRDLARREGW